MRVAVCQVNSRDDREINLRAARDLLVSAAERKADLAVLPEYVDFLGRGTAPAEPIDGEFGTYFADIASELGMWVLAGSFHERIVDSDHTYNTSLLFDRSGSVAGVYRKMHLYDVEIPGRVSYRESATVMAGSEIVTVPVEQAMLGMSICYDLRFPELYRRMSTAGATVLAVPAAFMAHTGRDHWEVLLRARAIENQCFVVAAGQIGDHGPGRTCYGRSMVIDPWGTVIGQVPDTVGLTVVDLDFDRLAKVRQELPALASRRVLD